jgi:hypothetical protein
MDIISRNVAKSTPNSLQEQRVYNSFMADENATSDVDQKNWLTLLTLKELAEMDDASPLKQIASEETRYLQAGIKALTDDTKDSADVKIVKEKLRGKFGRDLAGAVSLSKILKDRADEEQTSRLLASFVDPLADQRFKGERADIGGGAFVKILGKGNVDLLSNP